ncbi:hypothetical protein CapIbe_019813 [Capra ibex]
MPTQRKRLEVFFSANMRLLLRDSDGIHESASLIGREEKGELSPPRSRLCLSSHCHLPPGSGSWDAGWGRKR